MCIPFVFRYVGVFGINLVVFLSFNIELNFLSFDMSIPFVLIYTKVLWSLVS